MKTVYGFDQQRPPMWCEHTFAASVDGQLCHFMDGTLRATVPPEGWDDYAATWPDCESVVNSMRGPRHEKTPQTPDPAAP